MLFASSSKTQAVFANTSHDWVMKISVMHDLTIYKQCRHQRQQCKHQRQQPWQVAIKGLACCCFCLCCCYYYVSIENPEKFTSVKEIAIKSLNLYGKRDWYSWLLVVTLVAVDDFDVIFSILTLFLRSKDLMFVSVLKDRKVFVWTVDSRDGFIKRWSLRALKWNLWSNTM